MNEDSDRPREEEQDYQPERPMSRRTAWLLGVVITLFILTGLATMLYGACASRHLHSQP